MSGENGKGTRGRPREIFTPARQLEERTEEGKEQNAKREGEEGKSRD